MFFATLGLTTIAVLPLGKVSSRSTKLASLDLDEFAFLIPIPPIQDIFGRYLAEDEEVQALFRYFVSVNPQTEIIAPVAHFECINFLNYLHKSDLELHTKIEAIYIYLVLEELAADFNSGKKFNQNGRGVAGLFDAIKAVFPIDELRDLYEKKLETSPDFALLVEELKSGKFEFFIAALKDSEGISI